MSRIDNYRGPASQEAPKRSAHPDYEENLKHCERLCQNVKKHLLNGMNVKVSDSESLPKALLIISWSPGMYAKKGNCATPIFLHQNSGDFKKVTETVLNSYMKVVAEEEKINPKQPDFLSSSQKV